MYHSSSVRLVMFSYEHKTARLYTLVYNVFCYSILVTGMPSVTFVHHFVLFVKMQISPKYCNPNLGKNCFFFFFLLQMCIEQWVEN